MEYIPGYFIFIDNPTSRIYSLFNSYRFFGPDDLRAWRNNSAILVRFHPIKPKKFTKWVTFNRVSL